MFREYLAKFNPLLTIRFGATFKGKNDNEKYKNLVYTLDSLDAFRQRLVKGIVVDTVGSADAAQSLCYLSHHTGQGALRAGAVRQARWRQRHGGTACQRQPGRQNRAGLSGWACGGGHYHAKELLFTNGFALPLGEAMAYGMLAEQTQGLIIERAIANHFEREEDLFQRGIKSLSLFFIDAVALKYLPEGQKPAVIREAFEAHYRTHLQRTLARPDLHPPYRAYLKRSAAADIGKVPKGKELARSHSEKGEEEAIKLILQEKEKLLLRL